MPAKVFETPAIAEDMLREASKLGGKVTDAVKDSVRVANQQYRRSRDAAEDMLHEAKYTIKRKPFAAVAIGFASGFVLGGLFACAAMRKR